MTLREYLKLDCYDKKEDGTEMSHEDKFATVVNALGLGNISTPDMQKVKLALECGDEYLNSIPLRIWDALGSHLDLRSIGITSYSLSEKVCIVKKAAKMKAELE